MYRDCVNYWFWQMYISQWHFHSSVYKYDETKSDTKCYTMHITYLYEWSKREQKKKLYSCFAFICMMYTNHVFSGSHFNPFHFVITNGCPLHTTAKYRNSFVVITLLLHTFFFVRLTLTSFFILCIHYIHFFFLLESNGMCIWMNVVSAYKSHSILFFLFISDK